MANMVLKLLLFYAAQHSKKRFPGGHSFGVKMREPFEP